MMELPFFNEAILMAMLAQQPPPHVPWGAHRHTFSSPEQSPVKSGPPSASSMVLTSLLEKRVPTSCNLKDAAALVIQHWVKLTGFLSTYDGRSSRRMRLLLWREQSRTGVFPTRCIPNSVSNPCNRIGNVRAVVRSS